MGTLDTDSDDSRKLNGSGESSSARGIVGEKMNWFTNFVNENLIAARYGAFASIALLTAYGLSNTPLFFRFRRVSDIPASMFLQRKKLYGRVVDIVKTENQNNGSIQLLVRHLSPVGQILPKSWFDFLMSLNPINKSVEDNDTLKIQLAGIDHPPSKLMHYQPEQWLEKLRQNRTLVGLHLLARQAPQSPMKPSQYESPLLGSGNKFSDGEYDGKKQIAVCRVTYRPALLQLYASDIAQELVLTGNASAASSIFHVDLSSESPESQGKALKTIDASQQLQHMSKDAKYLDQLAKAEFEAARQSHGMWSVPEIRRLKQEIVDEVEFQTNAGFWRKIWRKIRG